MKKFEWIKSYYVMILGILSLGIFVSNILYSLIFLGVSIFVMSYRKKALDEMVMTSVLFMLFFLICNIVIKYIPFEFVAFNYSKGLVLMMLLVAFKSKFSFENFAEQYQDMALRLIVVVFATLALLMINYQWGLMAYFAAMFTIMLNDFIFQKDITKVHVCYDKIRA